METRQENAYCFEAFLRTTNTSNSSRDIEYGFNETAPYSNGLQHIRIGLAVVMILITLPNILLIHGSIASSKQRRKKLSLIERLYIHITAVDLILCYVVIPVPIIAQPLGTFNCFLNSLNFLCTSMRPIQMCAYYC